MPACTPDASVLACAALDVTDVLPDFFSEAADDVDEASDVFDCCSPAFYSACWPCLISVAPLPPGRIPLDGALSPAFHNWFLSTLALVYLCFVFFFFSLQIACVFVFFVWLMHFAICFFFFMLSNLSAEE